MKTNSKGLFLVSPKQQRYSRRGSRGDESFVREKILETRRSDFIFRCTVTFYLPLCQINVIEGVKLALKEH
ncbi:hypothetical protein H6G97_51095 [Nostoc flagelliforme FACHB-838]|uniref:Transposase n=1 Tax=Nostoc flagelliforme FACHB-838 TaxID=2692904 RepID=A0ABR8E671_9NOSO|nr:hypothetical protein [Nostoc flagelliforme FACHB-838]